MQLTEKHVISKNHQFYKEIDGLSFASKNLYNKANYFIRKSFTGEDKKYLNYNEIQKIMQNTEPEYKVLPSKVSQQILKVLDKNWKSFFKSIKDFAQNKNKYNGMPKLPNYKDSVKGRNIIIYSNQSLIKTTYKKEGLIHLSGTNIKISTKIKFDDIAQVRIIPYEGTNYQYSIEIVYNVPDIDLKDFNNRIVSIDMEVNNLATCSSNCIDFKPFIVNGRPLKSINQYYNKKLKKLKQELKIRENNRFNNIRKNFIQKQFDSIIDDRELSNQDKELTNKVKGELKNGDYEKRREEEKAFGFKKNRSTNRIIRLNQKRNNKVSDYLHKSSREIVNQLVSKNINTLVVGKNDNWKQDTALGKRNNQNFIQIPHAKFIDILKYKCDLVGIECLVVEESYTSKCSFLDNEDICKHSKTKIDPVTGLEDSLDDYAGNRIKRGLFKSNSGILINADLNGSLNILKKAILKCKEFITRGISIDNVFTNRIEAIVVSPLVLKKFNTKNIN